MKYIVVNIGCIECGVSSNIVGSYDNLQKAKRVQKLLNENEEAGWREGGQNYYEIFEIPPTNETKIEYLEYLNEA